MINDTVQSALQWIGKPVLDRVSGLEGVCIAITLDLFGSVKASLQPQIDDLARPANTFMIPIEGLIERGSPIIPLPEYVVAAHQIISNQPISQE